jgi:hypothetical protein
MLSDIKSGIQLLILAMFLGLVVYFGSGVYDKVPGMLAIPEKAQSESAKYTAERNRVLAESSAMLTAVPTLQYLSIQGTASAIENERDQRRAPKPMRRSLPHKDRRTLRELWRTLW